MPSKSCPTGRSSPFLPILLRRTPNAVDFARHGGVVASDDVGTFRFAHSALRFAVKSRARRLAHASPRIEFLIGNPPHCVLVGLFLGLLLLGSFLFLVFFRRRLHAATLGNPGLLGIDRHGRQRQQRRGHRRNDKPHAKSPRRSAPLPENAPRRPFPTTAI